MKPPLLPSLLDQPIRLARHMQIYLRRIRLHRLPAAVSIVHSDITLDVNHRAPWNRRAQEGARLRVVQVEQPELHAADVVDRVLLAENLHVTPVAQRAGAAGSRRAHRGWRRVLARRQAAPAWRATLAAPVSGDAGGTGLHEQRRVLRVR